MKKFLTLFVVIALCSFSVYAQTTTTKKASKPRPKATWNKSLVFSLYAGQAGSSNWASGTEPFALSANAFLNAHANRSAGSWYWNNNFIASFGLHNTRDLGFRKNDDKIDYFSSLGLKMKKAPSLAWAAAANFRSQFWKGYDYDYLNQGLKRRTSGFFAPAYVTVAPIGLEWTPTKGKGSKSFFVGAAVRGVIVSNAPYSYIYQGGIVPSEFVNDKNPSTQERSVAEMYGVDPEKTIQWQVGPYFSSVYSKEILKNVNLSGRLDIYSDLTHQSGANLDFFFTNTFNLKVNKWLSAVYSIDLAYDDDIKKFGTYKDRTGTQVKSVLGVGLNAKIK